MKRIFSVILLCVLLCACVGAQARVSAIRLKHAKVTMRAGGSAVMPIQVKPAADSASVTWSSSNPSVASVDQTGRISALKQGVAVITASASDGGSAKASCRVTVKPAVVTRLTLDNAQLALKAGGDPVQLNATIAPEAAKDSALKWTSSNKKVATVSSAGLVTPLRAGTAKITVKAPSGKKATCAVKVSSNAAVRRALVIGESRENKAMGLTALPMVPSEVKSIADMFKGKGVTTSTLLNSTRAGMNAAIQSTFANASESDISFVYITCHGGLSGGAYELFPFGDGCITPAQLRTQLDRIPGKIVLMLGACYSGQVISKGGEREMAQAFVDAFIGAKSKSGEFRADKYQVLCAASGQEMGYGVVTTDQKTGAIITRSTYNFFGKAVSEGGGGKADKNSDNKITLNELYVYTYARVNALFEYWRARISGLDSATQTVVCYPTGSEFVLF